MTFLASDVGYDLVWVWLPLAVFLGVLLLGVILGGRGLASVIDHFSAQQGDFPLQPKIPLDTRVVATYPDDDSPDQ